MLVIIFVIYIFLPGSISSEKLTWFEAQAICRGQNESLTFDQTQSRSFYWTGYYKRLSYWIKIIGCYNETIVREFVNQSCFLTSSSPGLCQEFCLSKNLTLFAVKANQCICLFHPLDTLPLTPDMCYFSCHNSLLLTSECGGNSSFNVFGSSSTALEKQGNCLSLQCVGGERFQTFECTASLKMICKTIEDISSRPWRTKMDECQSNGAYLLGNISLSNVTSACESVYKKWNDPRWIGVVRDTYETKDRGQPFSPVQQIFFKSCMKCKKDKNCEYVDCNYELPSTVYCTKVNYSTVTSPPSTTTGRVTETEPTKGTTELTTTTINKTQFTKSFTFTVTGTKETVDPPKNSTSNLSEKKFRGLEVSAIVLPIIFIILGTVLGGTGFICWKRRKAKKVKGPLPESMASNLNTNQRENEHIHHENNNVSNSSYFILEPKSSYEEFGNDIPQTENPYIEAKEGEYDHLGNSNSRRKVTDIDDYDETKRNKSLNKETEEGNYDHLENIPSRSNITDDTYFHTSSRQLDSSSDYDVANHMEQKDLENTYDHAGAGMHLQNDLNYDYSELKH